MTGARDPAFETALHKACDELALASWYRDCVRPLFQMPESQWPRCCGRGCEPCAEQLVAIAHRMKALLASPSGEAGQPAKSDHER